MLSVKTDHQQKIVSLNFIVYCESSIICKLLILLFIIIWVSYLFQDAVVHPCCNKIYLTEIYDEFPSDTFFPLIPSNLKEIPAYV